MKHVFGPVFSRRLGQSLGVSPIPAKTCTYNCVYCQLGRTRYLRVTPESYASPLDIFREIMRRCEQVTPDYVTISGDGEPTLSKDLGWLIREIKDMLYLPVAVFTNSSLLWRVDVQRALMNADVVIPSLDAGDVRTFKRINRAHSDICFENMLRGLTEFRGRFHGQLWLETMLVYGVNDSDTALSALGNLIDRLRPDRSYLMAPTRPPAEQWVRPTSPLRMRKALSLIPGAIRLKNFESGRFHLGHVPHVQRIIAEIASRHPLRWSQAVAIGTRHGAPDAASALLSDGDLEEIWYQGIRYVTQSECPRPSECHQEVGAVSRTERPAIEVHTKEVRS